jgi:phosphoserine aminotransferase
MKTYYFSPGPAKLPDKVRDEIQKELLDTFGIGVSIMEISHRSKYYEKINEETLFLAQKIFQVPNTHTLLFSVCGAQQHFSLVVQHLSAPNDEIAYTDTGLWAHLACQEASLYPRQLHLIYDGRPQNYISLDHPQTWVVPPQAKYVHLTVNNTVYGTEYSKIPNFGHVPLVLDMTSALGSRTDIPWESTGVIYASAQKNFGIAGVAVVIIRNDLLEQSKEYTKINHVGTALRYHAIHAAKSVLNTPPVLPIFALHKMLSWIDHSGGVTTMEKWAQKKAQLIYFEIDQGFYVGRAEKKDRSRHNFVFNLPTPKQDLHFIEEAAKQNILEIKGYKTVGGIRASLYNGTSVDSAQVLSHFMSYYRKKFG